MTDYKTWKQNNILFFNEWAGILLFFDSNIFYLTVFFILVNGFNLLIIHTCYNWISNRGPRGESFTLQLGVMLTVKCIHAAVIVKYDHTTTIQHIQDVQTK